MILRKAFCMGEKKILIFISKYVKMRVCILKLITGIIALVYINLCNRIYSTMPNRRRISLVRSPRCSIRVGIFTICSET